MGSICGAHRISRQSGTIELHQKTRTHRPHTKVLEFFVAILAGFSHLQEISRSAHPLDQDEMVAEAWGQAAWADYSGVSRTLHRLSEAEAEAIASLMDEISAPYIKREVELALQQTGYLVYDGDLTGRPVSSTSTTYPDTAFGYMGDTIRLGYQSALVSLHSPTYGRLWLSTRLHPGDTVSMTQAQALVRAAEARTGVAPRRRIELVAMRIQQAEIIRQRLGDQAARSEERLLTARAIVKDTMQRLNESHRQVTAFEAEYQREQRQPTSHCKLTRARHKKMRSIMPSSQPFICNWWLTKRRQPMRAIRSSSVLINCFNRFLSPTALLLLWSLMKNNWSNPSPLNVLTFSSAPVLVPKAAMANSPYAITPGIALASVNYRP